MTHRIHLMLLTFALSLASCAHWAWAQADAESEEVSQIKNPFFDRPVWKLWFRDPDPVQYSSRVRHDQANSVKTETFAPPAREDRRYPDFSDRGTGPARLPKLRQFDTPPKDAAGFWDDVYATMDFSHSGIRINLGDGEDGMQFRDEFIRITYGMPYRPTTRAQLGVNFTSQSFARRGRHIVDDYNANLEVEKTFFFLNCVRGTPSHASFNDNDPQQVHDDYDGLYGHSYQSVGQSSSEVYALTKMLVAGACMSRQIKDTLKLHGAYAPALLTFFKASLPYVDEQGQPLAYESELRHRVAYSSHGDVSHWHYARSNLAYHGYRDPLHIGGMIDTAHGMKAPPPVAILKLLSLSVEKNGKRIVQARPTDPRLQAVNKTLLRIWGNPEETITLRLDMRDSYDLEDRPLSFHLERVYPNQKNVSVKEVSEGVYDIVCRHDPALPKGRIPVIAVARNGQGIPSNPVFVNFYWPEKNERSDWLHYGRRRRNDTKYVKYDVTQNKRPLIEFQGLTHQTLWAPPGSEASFEYKARDPEGYPVIFYRWAGDVGTTGQGRFRWQVPEESLGKIHDVHLIASDGTGGFTGKRIKIVSAPAPTGLPQGWHATAIGSPRHVGQVTAQDKAFTLQCSADGLDLRNDQGALAFTQVQGDFDVVAKIESLKGDAAQPGLSLREGFADKVRFATVYVDLKESATPLMQGKPNYSPWGSLRARSHRKLSGPVRWLRMTRRGTSITGYASADGKEWLQLGSMELEAKRETFLGPILSGHDGSGGNATATMSVEQSPAEVLPGVRVTCKAKTNRDGSYPERVRVTLAAPKEGESLQYALAKDEEPGQFVAYSQPLQLGPGTHRLRARCEGASQVVIIDVVVKAKDDR